MERTPLFAEVPLEVRREWLRGFIDSNGKRSGPLVRLVSYDVGETLMRENEWGGNSFMILVRGNLAVFMKDVKTGSDHQANQILPGESFGEMSLFAGVPRNASVVAIGESSSSVLEISRQAFRGKAEKSASFIQQLNDIYEARGLSTAIERIRQALGEILTEQQLRLLQEISSFRVFGRSHLLCEQGQPMDKIFLILQGWVRRSKDVVRAADLMGWAKLARDSADLDFLGGGNFLGFDGLDVTPPPVWEYSATVMLRTEVMEIDLTLLRASQELHRATKKAFARFAEFDAKHDLGQGHDLTLEAAEEIITTGIVETDNVLVMDMDLCIRCGNCSYACEKIHGQSRLVRRGIQIKRTSQLAHKNQNLLIPEVCISCQDPECLTGCPTGAIARMAQGQIDITAATCTGCTACARLCPYNAISMVEENRRPQSQPGLGLQLTSWLGFSAPILPSPTVGTKKDNLIAVKCNLCADTPLNPPGARKPAYSCEENCPTAALARVNPHDYFNEVEKRWELTFQSPGMAIGRNIHRHDPLWWWCHVIGGLLILLILLGELWAWRHYGFDQGIGALRFSLRWLTGSMGGLATLAAMAYSRRRRVYTRRRGPLRYWMLSHIYFGGLAAVTTLLHGGSHKGGPLTMTLMISFDLVLITGLFGILTYVVAPRLLTRIEGEPILLEDLEARRKELRAEVAAARTDQKNIRELLDQAAGNFGSFTYLWRQVWRREDLSALLASARQEYRPILDRTAQGDNEEALLAHIEKLATLRRVDALIYLHRLLKVWLPPHIIAASLMLALLAIHLVQVVLFSVR